MWRSAFRGSQATARSRPGILSPRPSYQAVAGLASWTASQPANTRVRAKTTTRLTRDSSGTRTSRAPPALHAFGESGVIRPEVIAVVVPIAVGLEVNVIENHAEQPSAHRDEAADGPLGSVTTGASVAKDEHGTLELAGQDHRVADAEHRAGVEDDIGEPLTERFDRFAQPRGGEQLGRIHGDPARRNHEEIGNAARDDDLLQIGLAGQIRREARRLLHVHDPV